MLNAALVRAARMQVEASTKEAAASWGAGSKKKMSAEQKRRKRQQYYVKNRASIAARNRAWRQANRQQISRKKKVYNRQVSMGMRRQRVRISQGHSYTFGGFR